MQRYDRGKSNREISSLELALKMSKKTAEASSFSTNYQAVGPSYSPSETIDGTLRQPAFITNTFISPTISRRTVGLPASAMMFHRACAVYEQEHMVAAKIAAEQQFSSSRIAAFMHQQELLLRLLAVSQGWSQFLPRVTITGSPAQAIMITPEVTQQALSELPVRKSNKNLTFGVDNTVDDKNTTVDNTALEDIRKAKKPFPIKLYTILDDAEKEGNEDIISFQENGRAFSIHDKTRFIAEIVPRYFSTSQYSSFKRQLNLYGFKYTVLGTKHTPSYFHHQFIKENRQQCFAMKRKPQISVVSRGPTIKPDMACVKLYVETLRQNGTADHRVLLNSDRKHINSLLPDPGMVPSSQTPAIDSDILQDIQKQPSTCDFPPPLP